MFSPKLTKFYNWFLKKEVRAEAQPPNDPLGKWFAPTERSLPVYEPDTELERELIKAIGSFTGYSNDPTLLSANGGKLANILIDITEKHEYSPILDPGNIEVFRGIAFKEKKHFLELMNYYSEYIVSAQFINNNDVRSLTAKDIPDMIEKIWGSIVSDNYHARITGKLSSFVILPPENRLVQSWSSDKDVAASFANRFCRGGLIFKARTSKNMFFGKPGEIGKLGDPELASENETISVGPVNVDKAAFVYGLFPGDHEIMKWSSWL